VKEPEERGWVTVLLPAGEPRIHYCCSCMESLVRRVWVDEPDGDVAAEE
jgi:hypothetical protein